MLRNANLSACFAGLEMSGEGGAESEEVARRIACSAERRAVHSGEVVADRGEIGQEFFVVQSGSFEVVVGGSEIPTSALAADRAALGYRAAAAQQAPQRFRSVSAE